MTRIVVMGPVTPSASRMQGIGLLPRPKFSLDSKLSPWTGDRDPQDQYAEAVSLGKLYHDALTDRASEKVPENLQGVVLKSRLFDCTQYFARTEPHSMLMTKDDS